MMPNQLTRRATVWSLVLAGSLLWGAPTPARPAAPQDAAPANICFLTSLYRDLMGRPPDAIELANGLSFLISNGRDVYAGSLLADDGYRTVLIQGFYSKFLGRPASGGEVASWIALLSSGGTDEQVISAIVGTVEYFYQARVGADYANFIRAVYLDLLDRPASPSEVSSGLISLGSQSRPQYVTPILSSVEYRSVIIQGWYQTYLRRPATPSEVSSAQSSLSGGGSDEEVIASILGTLEYFNGVGRCAAYLPLVKR